MLMNVHGSMKLSDVMITVHFTAQLSDYGFTQLAEELEEVSDTWPHESRLRCQKVPTPANRGNCKYQKKLGLREWLKDQNFPSL
ncbi:hypothetical protein DKX38_000673 [Salix brachista]|uniref:Uncharacterized protein n=1 Tax=Salix brachista TaxID=2182728 RepID=A0A5N5P229_9ROSI|nr:hypothetical protein DKX38_000673 [Salix brachista]